MSDIESEQNVKKNRRVLRSQTNLIKNKRIATTKSKKSEHLDIDLMEILPVSSSPIQPKNVRSDLDLDLIQVFLSPIKKKRMDLQSNGVQKTMLDDNSSDSEFEKLIDEWDKRSALTNKKPIKKIPDSRPRTKTTKRKRKNQPDETEIPEFSEVKKTKKKNPEMSIYDQRHQSFDVAASSSGNYLTKLSSARTEEQPSTVLQHSSTVGPDCSMSTLCNIGNTCYLNAVIYTLRYAPSFLHNIHHLIEDLSQINQKIVQNRGKSSSLGRNVAGLQGQSGRSWSSKDLASLGNSTGPSDLPKSKTQIVTERLHEVYQNLHQNEKFDKNDSFNPGTLLNAVQDKNPMFEGNHQQDAHEFLICMFDSLRETSNLLIQSILDCPEIIANGYVSAPPEPQLDKVEVSTPAPPTTKISFFQRISKNKTKEDKKTIPRVDSPSRDTVIDLVLDDEQLAPSKEEILDKLQKLGLNYFSQDFEGITVSTIKCLTCETTTEHKETMIDLSVALTEDKQKCLEDPQSFFQKSCLTKDYFQNENKYRCNHCTGYTEATRTTSFEVLPRLLVIQLKRFSGGMKKINCFTPTPLILSCFCKKCEKLPESEKFHIYKLYSVITHVGATMSVGHYIAYIRYVDDCNDYINCCKDNKLKKQSSGLPPQPTNLNNGVEKSSASGLKKIFGRVKSVSSSDVMKNSKNSNGSILSKTNGDNVNSNLTTAAVRPSSCQALGCCGIYANRSSRKTNNNNYGSSMQWETSPDFIDSSAESQNHVNGATGGNFDYHRQQIESTWYMCDDDKIKAFTGKEFEELLNNKNISITPYLLFYARSDLR